MEKEGSVLGVEGRGEVTAMSNLWNPGGSGRPNRVGLVTNARTTLLSMRLGKVCIGDTSGELAPLSRNRSGVGSFLGSCYCFSLAFFFYRRSRGGISSTI